MEKTNLASILGIGLVIVALMLALNSKSNVVVADTTINPQKLDVSASVNLVYEIK